MPPKRKPAEDGGGRKKPKAEEGAAFTLTQFGGSSGGSAGDACLIKLGDEVLIVDFGVGAQRESLTGALGRASYAAIVTHFHADHCGTPALRRGATALYVGPSSSMTLLYEGATSLETCKVASNDEQVWSVASGALDASVWFIEGSGIEDHSQEENAHSAGVYGRVARDDTVVFTWASLGDMVPEAWAKVSAVLPEGTLNYLKMPHHGSPNNHMADLFKNHVDERTVIASSGYNSLSDEWAKILLANSKLKKEQIQILTHHPKDNLGMVWSDYVRPSTTFTVSQTKAY